MIYNDINYVNRELMEYDVLSQKSDISLFKSDSFDFLKFLYSCQGFTKFLKLVCVLNHINNMATMLLLFAVMLSYWQKNQLI